LHPSLWYSCSRVSGNGIPLRCLQTKKWSPHWTWINMCENISVFYNLIPVYFPIFICNIIFWNPVTTFETQRITELPLTFWRTLQNISLHNTLLLFVRKRTISTEQLPDVGEC
jgi:uncharacterized membrane protein